MSAPPSQAEAERVLSDLSNDLMSPYCPGRTISSCSSSQARKLEDHILDEAKAGKSKAEIQQELVDRFGTQIVGNAPQPAIIYGSAALGILSLVLLAWAARRWLGQGQGTAAAPPSGPAPVAPGAPTVLPNASERQRLEDALDELDEF